MINFSHEEAILFRVLADFFGKERVIPKMSVMAVCGGKLPQLTPSTAQYVKQSGAEFEKWAQSNKCLFTIVDASDNPCLVIEFFSGFSESVDVVEVEHQTYLPSVLKAAGVKYVTMTNAEFSDMVNPGESFDFFAFLKEKVGEQIEN